MLPDQFPNQSPKQKKIVLAAINASYVHSNPAVYSLRRSAVSCAHNISFLREERNPLMFPQVDIAEYTINDRYEDILFDLIGRGADAIGLSVYIWNARICLSLLADLRRLHPAGTLLLFAGGPEASTHPETYLDSCDFVLTGEGEAGFSKLCATFSTADLRPSCPADELPGAVFLKNGKLQYSTAESSATSIDTMPFLYDGTEDFANRIIYYESSRGCPFRCTYCLSSLDAPVRYRCLDTVLDELQFFLDRNVSLVKFTDRTFNANASRARNIWAYLRDHDNQTTCFHFEIGADLLQEEDLSLLKSLRPGLIQLEIGIQSANPQTLEAIRRTADNSRIFQAIRSLTKAQNIALHTDLIAGLPFENLPSFRNSFNLVYALRAHQFQLGFLKVLAGTEMKSREAEYGLVSSSRPPYTVLATKWLSSAEIDHLRGIADMTDIFWNSGLFRHALPYLEGLFSSAYDMYDTLLAYYRQELGRKSLSPRSRGDFLVSFAQAALKPKETQDTPDLNSCGTFSQKVFEELLRFDNLLHFHPSRRMSAEAVFESDFLYYTVSSPCPRKNKEEKTGPYRIRFDYTHIHPVTGEAVFTLLP